MAIDGDKQRKLRKKIGKRVTPWLKGQAWVQKINNTINWAGPKDKQKYVKNLY